MPRCPMERKLLILDFSSKKKKLWPRLRGNARSLPKELLKGGKKGKAIAKIHERIRNRRKDFCHKESKKIVNEYQYICVEDLAIKEMIAGSSFAKSIADASWNQFCQYLTYKAEEAGRKLGLVNPAYTTQDCSRCGHREPKGLSGKASHLCRHCGYHAQQGSQRSTKYFGPRTRWLGRKP